jgi:hypothetical protein
MDIAKPLFYAVALASLSLPACSGTAGEEEGPIGTAEQAAQGHGSHGGVCHGSLTANSLTANSLTANSLTANSLTANALKDPLAREVLTYIVSCALPADQTLDVSIEGVSYAYNGELGLAPEWGNANGHCGQSCQEWVSACVLARIDYLGEHREISVRGDNPGLKACDPGEDAYTVREATYFGNIFGSSQRRFACLSPGSTGIPRVCGPSLDSCVVDVEASCDDVCAHPTPDGAFQNCRPGDGDENGKPYHGSITVFLKP